MSASWCEACSPDEFKFLRLRPIETLMDTLSVAASGLRSAEIRLEAAAHNIANLGTEGVRPLRVIQEEHEAGGSTARVVRAESPHSVDSVEALVEQLRASYQYTASARLLAVELDMRGRITDMLV